MDSVLFWLIKGPLYLISLLPLRILFIFSDMFYFLVYYIVGYRKKVVENNLKESFPDKSPAELKKIEKGFYHHFCDYIFETIKLLHISDKEMLRRFKFINMELLNEISEDGKPQFLMVGHFGNWEWLTSINLTCPKRIYMAQVYRPLRNKAADKFFLKLRSRFNTFSIAKNDALREIIRLRKEGKQAMVGMIADQTPSPNNIHLWVKFLNQNTPCLSGTEKIAKKIDANVLYLDIKKVSRGYYETEFKVISLNPKETKEFEITETYMRMLEETILRQPQYWLWTHKRWKHKHLYNPESSAS